MEPLGYCLSTIAVGGVPCGGNRLEDGDINRKKTANTSLKKKMHTRTQTGEGG